MILFWSCLALASPEGDAILAKVDSVTRLKSAEMTLQLEVLRPNGSSVQRSLKIWQAENDARLVRLTAPSRLKGVGLLVSSDDCCTQHGLSTHPQDSRGLSGRFIHGHRLCH